MDTYELLYEQCAEVLGSAPAVVLRHGTGSYFAFVSEFVGAPTHKGSSGDGFLQALAAATTKLSEGHVPEVTKKMWSQDPFQMMGETAVDVSKIRAVERGQFDQDRQDWRAVLVLEGGERLPVSLFVQEALAALNNKGIT